MILRAAFRVVGLAAGLLLLGMTASQATTYVYTSPFYVAPTGTFTTAMRITGSFTTASPLPANMPFTAIGPAGNGLATSWSFSNGITTFTQANSAELYGDPNDFSVGTDSLGNISAFNIGLVSPGPPHIVGTVLDFMFISHNFEIQALNQASCAIVTGNVCTFLPFSGAGTISQPGGGSFAPNTPVPPAPVVAVPTLNYGGLAGLMALLAALALVSRRVGGRSRRPIR
jgi:hypothetical protein